MELNTFWRASAATLLALSPFAFTLSAHASTGVVDPLSVVAGAGEGIGLGLQVDWLYLKPRQDGNEFVVLNSLNTATNLTTATAKSVKGDYNSGVRATLQYKIEQHDQWDIKLAYSYVENNHSKNIKKTDAAQNLYPFLRSPNNVNIFGDKVETATAKWNTNLDLVDLELGRHFTPKATAWTAIRPYAGLRWAKLDQTLTTNYDQSFSVGQPQPSLIAATETIKNNSDFKAIGLKAGFDILFGVTEHLNLYSNFAFSLLAATYDTQQFVSYNNASVAAQPGLVTGSTKGHYHTGKAVTDIGFGAVWHMLFNNNSQALSITAGWEQQQWHNFNQFVRPVATGAKFSSLRNLGDFTLQGFKIGARFDF